MAEEHVVSLELTDGLAVVVEKMPDLKSGASVICFRCGSRNELPNKSGLTNLLLGLMFRQTKNKTSREIQRYIESLGAVLDSFVSKEISGIYARYLTDKLVDVWNLSEEIISLPLFTEEELQKEKKLIENEIISDEDDAEKYLFTRFYKQLFPAHPLGNRIVGEIASISQILLDDIKNYYNYFLCAPLCISVAGNIDLNFVVEKAEQLKSILRHSGTNSLININQKVPQNIKCSSINIKKAGLLQSYTAIGWYTYSYLSKYYFPTVLANTIFGGCISSRLYYEIREKRGLVYSISSFLDFYSDVGIWGIYFVTQPKLVDKVTEIILNEVQQLRTRGISHEELDLARNYIKSDIVIRNENPLARAMRNARNKLLLSRTPTILDTLQEIEDVTLSQVNEAIAGLEGDPLVVNLIPEENDRISD
ncbi:MAG: pitrilysin family protein [candidate division WOR-3 bacterium]